MNEYCKQLNMKVSSKLNDDKFQMFAEIINHEKKFLRIQF